MRRSDRLPTMLALAVAALGAACAASVTGALPAQPVGPDYAEGGGRFSSGTELTVRATAFDSGGRVGVCAAWAAVGINTSSVEYIDWVLETGVLQLSGRNILQGFDDFPSSRSRAALDGMTAGCVATSAEWRPGDNPGAVNIAFTRFVVSGDPDDGIELIFIPRH